MSMADNLTDKQRAFIHHYMTNGFNATQAARSAGYDAADETTFASIGWENLRKQYIKEEIDKLFAELHMGRDEVLGRLSEMARGDIRHFINEDGLVDLGTDDAKAHSYLLREVEEEIVHGSNEKTGNDWEKHRHKVKLHDPKDAIIQMGKHHKLFGDPATLNIDVTKLTDEQVARIANGEDPIKVLATSRTSGDGEAAAGADGDGVGTAEEV